MSKLGNVRIRKNSGAIVGTRRLLNFIEGGNVTLTIVDDGPGDEVDITIASGGAAATLWVDQFYPAIDTDSNKGTYPTVLMADGVDITVRQLVVLPDDIASLTVAEVVIIPNASGNIRRGVVTNFAEICANEDYQTHTDSIAAGQVAVDIDEVECIDITAALTGALGGDVVGIEFTRYGSDALDTVNADVHFLGILIEGNP